MLFKNVIDLELISSVLEACNLTNENYKKTTVLIWQNDSSKTGLTLKLYSQTIDLKNYIAKISWVFDNDKFVIIDSCKDFGKSLNIELSKKIIDLLN